MIDFPDALIEERLNDLRRDGFPASATERLFQLLFEYASGEAAESAVAEIIQIFDEDQLSRLLLEYVYPEFKAIPGVESQAWHCQAPHVTWEALLKHGIGVRESTAEGWTLTLPDGESFSAQFRNLGEIDLTGQLPGRDVALARLALWASAATEMRKRASAKPDELSKE